jgi:hypothetical protein
MWWAPGTFAPEIKLPKREANTEFYLEPKGAWSYTSTLPYFMAWHKDKFTYLYVYNIAIS